MFSPSILVAVPTMGSVRVELVGWLKSQPDEYFFTNQLSPHSTARNHIVDAFLKTNHDFLLMIDADTVPPPDAVRHLLETQRKTGASVVTGITPILRAGVPVANVYIRYPDVESPPSLEDLPESAFAIVGCGASCLLIARSVFQKIKPPYFKAIEYDNGARCSEDLYFCQQVNNAKLSIVADPRVVCQHIKEHAI